MSTRDSVQRAAELTARCCAEVLTAVSSGRVESGPVRVEAGPAALWRALEFPLFTVRVAFVGDARGDNFFLLSPGQATTLAAAMMGPDDARRFPELELSAIAEAMNQMMGRVTTRLAAELGLALEIAPPETHLAKSPAETGADAGDGYVARFALRGEGLESEVAQVIPRRFAELLELAYARSTGRDDRTLRAAEHLAALHAGGADVLADAPVEVSSCKRPGHAAQLPAPLVLVELDYLGALAGSDLLALDVAQARALAGCGDGDEIDLERVAERAGGVAVEAAARLSAELSVPVSLGRPRVRVLERVEEIDALAARAFVSELRAGAFTLYQLSEIDVARRVRDALAEAPATRMDRDTGADGRPALRDAGLGEIPVRITAELGRTVLPVGRVASLPAGAVVKLDRAPADPLDVLVNGRRFAAGKLVLVDGEYAVQIVSVEPWGRAA